MRGNGNHDNPRENAFSIVSPSLGEMQMGFCVLRAMPWNGMNGVSGHLFIGLRLRRPHDPSLTRTPIKKGSHVRAF